MNTTGNGYVLIDKTNVGDAIKLLSKENFIIDGPVEYSDGTQIDLYYKGLYDEEIILSIFRDLNAKELVVDFWCEDDLPCDGTFLELSMWRVYLTEEGIKIERFLPVLGSKLKGETECL